MAMVAVLIMHRCQIHSKDLRLLVILCQAMMRSMAYPCGNLSVYD